MIEDLKEIRSRRVNLGWTQHGLAKKAGVSQSIIAKIESKKTQHQPTFSVLKKIDTGLTEGENQESEKAVDVMTKGVKCVEVLSPVKKAVDIMTKHGNGYSQLPLLRQGQVVGLLTETFLLKAEPKPDSLIPENPGGEGWEQAPTVPEKTPVQVLKKLLKTFPCVLVMDGSKLKGIVTKTDVLLK